MRRRQVAAAEADQALAARKAAQAAAIADKEAALARGRDAVGGDRMVGTLREGLGLSVKDLSDLSGVSVSYIRTIESAEKKRIDVLKVLDEYAG